MNKPPIPNPPELKPRVLWERILIFGTCDYCHSHIVFNWYKFKKVCAGGCENYKNHDRI